MNMPRVTFQASHFGVLGMVMDIPALPKRKAWGKV
jgi:hypothetical protein